MNTWKNWERVAAEEIVKALGFLHDDGDDGHCQGCPFKVLCPFRCLPVDWTVDEALEVLKHVEKVEKEGA